jgi:hypothetical protein
MARRRAKRRERKRQTESSPNRRWLSFGWRGIAWVIGALGIVGAIGGWLVNQYASSTLESVTRASALTATAMFDDDAYTDGYVLVLPKPPKRADFESVRDCSTLLVAARQVGGVHTNPLLIKLLLEGRTVRDVTIVGMRAKVITRTRPLHGAEVSCAGGGEISPIRITFNLDRDDPVAERVTEEGSTEGPYFGKGYVLSLKKGEVASLLVTAATKRSFVR